MNNAFAHNAIRGLTCAACCVLAAANADCQAPSNYGAYYSQSAGSRGVQSSNRYLYDKYMYQRPTVSPYVNLARPGSDSATSYQTFVRPELERREAAAQTQRAYVQQRKLQGNVGQTVYPGAAFSGGTVNNALMKPATAMKSTPSSYYNHWYGGWANR